MRAAESGHVLPREKRRPRGWHSAIRGLARPLLVRGGGFSRGVLALHIPQTGCLATQ